MNTKVNSKSIKNNSSTKQASQANSRTIIVSANGKPRKNYSRSVPPNPYKLQRINTT